MSSTSFSVDGWSLWKNVDATWMPRRLARIWFSFSVNEFSALIAPRRTTSMSRLSRSDHGM